MTKLFIGIEGVGMRQSVVVASDKTGRILGATRLRDPLSLTSLTKEKLKINLSRLFLTICDKLRYTIDNLSRATVCIGMTGITFPFDGDKELPGIIREMDIKTGNLICMGGPRIIFASHAISDTGSCLTCSMGSMAYVKSSNGECQYGGWGPAIGDEGSGFYMGRQALRAIGESYDAGKSEDESVLWQKVKKWLNEREEYLNEWRHASIIWRRYSKSYADEEYDLRTAIASYAEGLSCENHFLWRSLASGIVIPLMEAAKDGDEIASGIVTKSAQLLSEQLLKTCKTAEGDINHGPLVLYGGVFRHHPEFVTEVLNNLGCTVKVILPGAEGTMRPVMGALLYALGNSVNDQLRLPEKAVIKKLLSEQKRGPHEEVLRND